MATADLTLTGTPAKLVAAGDDFWLTFETRAIVRVATVDADDEPPTVDGHRLSPGHLATLTRPLIGPGDVYAWTEDGGSVGASLSAWTPAE